MLIISAIQNANRNSASNIKASRSNKRRDSRQWGDAPLTEIGIEGYQSIKEEDSKENVDTLTPRNDKICSLGTFCTECPAHKLKCFSIYLAMSPMIDYSSNSEQNILLEEEPDFLSHESNSLI